MGDAKPSVTVVIPALNEEHYIGRCLESVMRLDYPRELLTVCLVDNYSDDRTLKIASTYNVSIKQTPRSTISHSRNVGAMGATSGIIAFLDADCMVAPGWLSEAVKHFSLDNVVAVGTYPSVLMEESNRLQQTWAALCRGTSEGIRRVDWLPSANLIVRKNAFEKVGGFDEALATCEDADLGYRLKEHGWIVNDPKVTVYHLREPRTFREFFRKEFWHSRNNLKGALSHGWHLSEIPSVLAPLLFGVGMVVAIVGRLVGIAYTTLGLLLPIIVVLSYSLRGYKKGLGFLFVASVYAVYFSARSLSACCELFSILRSIRIHRGSPDSRERRG